MINIFKKLLYHLKLLKSNREKIKYEKSEEELYSIELLYANNILSFENISINDSEITVNYKGENINLHSRRDYNNSCIDDEEYIESDINDEITSIIQSEYDEFKIITFSISKKDNTPFTKKEISQYLLLNIINYKEYDNLLLENNKTNIEKLIISLSYKEINNIKSNINLLDEYPMLKSLIVYADKITYLKKVNYVTPPEPIEKSYSDDFNEISIYQEFPFDFEFLDEISSSLNIDKLSLMNNMYQSIKIVDNNNYPFINYTIKQYSKSHIQYIKNNNVINKYIITYNNMIKCINFLMRGYHINKYIPIIEYLCEFYKTVEDFEIKEKQELSEYHQSQQVLYNIDEILD